MGHKDEDIYVGSRSLDVVEAKNPQNIVGLKKDKMDIASINQGIM